MNDETRPGYRVTIIKPSGARALFKAYGADELGQARCDRDALRGFDINAEIEGEGAPASSMGAADATSSQDTNPNERARP